MKNKILILLISVFTIGCSTKKEILYFQGIEGIDGMESLMEFEPVFEINDILHIQVSSFDPEVALPFQMNAGSVQSGQSRGGSSNIGGSSVNSSQNSGLMGYLVDLDGTIQFPVLGSVDVVGKSRSELQDYLTTEIRRYVKDAVVAVRLLNFRVVVLGETGQSVVQVQNERISVPELIATVGGITYDGRRDNILVIREVEGVKTYGYVDLTTADVFKNPFYYLKQNDIVYVEPTYRQVKSAGWITSWQGLVSLATTAFSLIILFTR